MEKWPGSDDPTIAKQVEEEYARAAVDRAFAKQQKHPTFRAVVRLVSFTIVAVVVVTVTAKIAWQLAGWVWDVA